MNEEIKKKIAIDKANKWYNATFVLYCSQFMEMM